MVRALILLLEVLKAVFGLLPVIQNWWRERQLRALERIAESALTERQRERIRVFRLELRLKHETLVAKQKADNEGTNGGMDFTDWNSGK